MRRQSNRGSGSRPALRLRGEPVWRGAGRVVTRRNLPLAARRGQRRIDSQPPGRVGVAIFPGEAVRMDSRVEGRMEDILFDAAAGVATITLNRPDVLNSFTRSMARQLREALDRVRDDPSLRAVVLTGAGRAFCAGQDLAEAMPREGERPDLGAIVRESYNPVVRAIRLLEKPVIAAVNGVAAGAGANIAFACDIVFASTEAAFVQSFARVGLIPDSGGTFIL